MTNRRPRAQDAAWSPLQFAQALTEIQANLEELSRSLGHALARANSESVPASELVKIFVNGELEFSGYARLGFGRQLSKDAVARFAAGEAGYPPQ